jgi:hypothetical protein
VRLASVIVSISLSVAACDDGGSDPVDAAPAHVDAQAAPEGDAGGGTDGAPPTTEAATALGYTGPAGGTLSLRPAVLVDGAWVGAGADCALTDDTLRCPTPVGPVSARHSGDETVLWLDADVQVEVQGIALVGEGTLPGARGWLSNGFQSWSQSGVLGLGAPPGEATTRLAVQKVADPETVRGGAELSWWYSYVDEAAVRANAERAAALLMPVIPEGAPPLRIVVDDGWQLGWGDWRPNEKFPSGLDGLAADLHGDGFEVGVWLAPLLVAQADPLAAEHPDWFVDGPLFPHLKNGPMRVLDVTHPDAAAHLEADIARIVGWGYGLLKIDFLFAGLMEGRRASGGTGLQAYHEALRVIRRGAGEDTVLLAVGAPATPSLPYVDAWRVGPDIAVEPLDVSYPFIPNQLRTIAARWPYCLRTLCDADPVLLRGLPRGEVELGAFVVATSGGALFLSDDLPALDVERPAWGLGEWAPPAIAGVPMTPLEWFPPGLPDTLVTALQDHLEQADRHVVPRLWQAQDGRVVRVNVGSEAAQVDGERVPPRAAR